jgi:hypothetical protein
MVQRKYAKNRSNKKSKSPGKQPICGLSAAARCANIIFKTAYDVDKFRSLCLKNNLVKKKKSWFGGTTAADRSRICKFFGLITKEINVCAILEHKNLTIIQPGSENKKNISVKKLLNSACFFKSKNEYLLSVNAHCVYIKTNCTRNKMTLYDQRNKKMKIKLPDHAMKKLLRQRVRKLFMVTKI